MQAIASEGSVTQIAQESASLEPGKPIERELSGGQSHFYKITLTSGQYLRIVVSQRGIDALVALFTPDGRKIGEVDGERVTVGAETVSAITEAAGAYGIEVRSVEKTAKTGRYEIKLEELRDATVEDKYRVAAEALFREAEKVWQGTLEERKKGLENYYEALELYRRVGDRSKETVTLRRLGRAHFLLWELQKAMEKYDEALQLSRALGDRREEASALTLIGGIYRSQGEPQKALKNYNEALQIRRSVGDRRGEAHTLNNMGLVHWSLWDMREALEKFNEALPLSRAVGDRYMEGNILSNIAVVHLALGETQKALEKDNEALLILQTLGARLWESAILNGIGEIYWSQRETQKALEKFTEALQLSRVVGDHEVEADTLDSIGEIYWSQGETQKALEKYNEALPIRRVVGTHRGTARTLHKIGEVYRSLGETQKALDKFNEALLLSRAAGDRNGEAVTLLGIARVEQTRGNLTQAHQTIEQAIGIVETLRAAIREDHRASYLASRREYYESYIDILAERHRQNQTAGFDATALAVSERAHARSLLDLLSESRADIRQGVDSSLLERERSLQQRLNAKAAAQVSLLNRKHTTEQADAAAKEIAAITSEYEELRAQIRARNPRYAALTQPQPLILAEIQQQVLDPDTLLLEYSLGDNASYLFVVSQTSITSHQVPKRAEIEAATRRVRELLTAPQPQPGDTEAKYQARIREARESYWPQAAVLSRMLLGPAASQLGGKRLLIVADGALQYLPFGALPAPETEIHGDGETERRGDREMGRRGDGGTGRNGKPLPVSPSPRLPVVFTPLIVNNEIVHLPSASALAVLRRELAGRKPAAKTVAVLADPVFSADDARVKSGAKTQAVQEAPHDLTRSINDVRGELRRLLLTRDEAEAILSVTPRTDGFGALDFRANRATATGDELSGYRVVHFATHGLLNSEHPELSGIVLSLVDERGQQQDGFLRLHEIFNLRLPAELVVLSACQTALGKEVKGEGLVGLTRGFMYAGAARVVASLWQVDDAATAELMKRFYRRMLKDGMRPAAALRAAQIEMWKKPQWQSPFYWGGFTLQGEWK